MSLFNYTWKQHFQFGYLKPESPQTDAYVRWMAKREQADEVFVAKYGRGEFAFPTWREANREAARRILLECQARNLRPLILYSGGLDSEIVLLSFLEARAALASESLVGHEIEIDIATFRLANDANQHDILYIQKFRQRVKDLGLSNLGLQFHERELDALTFWKTDEFMELARKHQIVSPIVVCQLWLCEEMLKARADYLPIIGQGEIHLVKATPPSYEPGISPYLPSKWSIVETENLCGLYRYFIQRKTPAVPGFFQYIPEQFEAQLRTNRVLHELVSNQRVGKLGTRTSKPEILAFDYPELETRPKFHGFETIEAEHDRVRKHLGTVMAECEGHWYKEVFELYRDVRPLELTSSLQDKSPHTAHDDWQFFFGKPGAPTHARRLDVQDIFVTEWTSPDSILKTWKIASHISLKDAAAQMTTAAKAFLTKYPKATLFHDGSALARWLHALMSEVTQTEVPIIDARAIPRLHAHDVCRDLFLTDLTGDTDLYLQFKACASFLQSNDGVLILPRLNPRLHAEPLFQSGNSYTWIESEKEARLLASLHAVAGRQSVMHRLALPWTNQSLVEACLCLVRNIGWTEWLEEQTPRNQEIAQLSQTRYESVRHRTQGFLDQVPHPKLPYMNATTVLRLEQDLEPASRLHDGIAPLRGVLAKYHLEEVPLSEWIPLASHATTDFRLGGNLYYRQTLRGLDLLSENSRIAVGIRRDGKVVSSALLQVLDPDGPNGKGVLRIRSVTTDSLYRHQGLARELVQNISAAADEALASSFASIEVWAAPEILSGFLSADFKPAENLLDRAEFIHDVQQDRLIESTRRLKPLRRSLVGKNV
mgnify:CR=1 FL=1